MNKNSLITSIVVEEKSSLTYIEVCHKYKIPKELLIEMLEQGFFPNQPTEVETVIFNSQALHHIEVALRLHQDLGINLQGAALALDLLDTIETIRQELSILRKHLSNG